MQIQDPMVGSSEVFRAFAAELAQVASTAVTVLLEGESGSGKSRAARTLHALGPRVAGPLVSIDLAALSPSLLEAELFGHEAGAFTGAQHARAGRIRSAAGGTLVLEGVDRLHGELQVKLLRTLQERTVEPLGGETAVPVDVRLVATCASDLRAEVEAGRFREDLYWRLAVVTLRVPPLRARAGDIPELASHLARVAAERVGAPARPFTPGALERLAAHPWPGNVRELENAVERVLVLRPMGEEGEAVAARELDFLSEATRGVATRLARESLAHGIDLESMIQAMMEEALRQQRGNRSAAARQLGLSRRAFEYRRSRRAPGSAEGTP